MGTEATELLRRAEDGDREAAAELLHLVYAELRRIAGAVVGSGPEQHTLQPTALVHEAWMRLCDHEGRSFRSRSHFLAVAARAMRSILVDHARTKRAEKRGGGARALPLDEALAMAERSAGDLIGLDAALERLERREPDLARIVELRFFGGMTIDEVAAHVGTSARSVDRGWRAARAWLRRELAEEEA